MLIEDKKNLIEDKKKLDVDKDDLKERIHKLELEKHMIQSKLVAIVNMRSLFETMLAIWLPKKSPTTASKELVTNLILDGKSKLTPKARQFLIDLEGSSSGESSVVNELKDLYHELSKKLHFPDIQDTGFFCGGPMPLRAATGIAILMLQKERPAFKMNIRYCDENYKVLALITCGTVQKQY